MGFMRFIRRLRRLIPLKRFSQVPPLVTVLRLHGTIAADGPRSLNLPSLAHAIDHAFNHWDASAVALQVNSPGGSPVQSALIHRRIRQFAEERNIPVFAFTEDVAASGGYWLALAADEIFAEETSIVGSIGVITAGFGFAETLRRLGITRRLYTAGERKHLLDPFLAEDPGDVERLTEIQKEMHESFKALVRSRRGKRLAGDESALFNGDVFTGRTALTRGLVDGIGDLRGVMRQRFGKNVHLHLVNPPQRSHWLSSFLPFRRRRAEPTEISGEILREVLATIEERFLWNRFGL